MKKVYLKSRKDIDRTKTQLQNRLEKIAILEQNSAELTEKYVKKQSDWKNWENKIIGLAKVDSKNPILRIWKYKQNLIMTSMDKTVVLLESLDKQIKKAKKEYEYRLSVANFDNSSCKVVEKDNYTKSSRENLPRKLRKLEKRVKELKEKGIKTITKALEKRPGVNNNGKKILPSNWRKKIVTKYAI